MRMLLLGYMAVAVSFGATRFYIEDRTDFQNAKEFGTAGPYESIAAKAVTDAGEGRVQVLKPRDPAKGNGTVVVDLNRDGWPRDQRLFESGFTLIRIDWRDKKSTQAGIHEILQFLRFSGGPMLLGDQPRFLKRTIAIDDGTWLAEFVGSGQSKDEKGRPLIDGALTTKGESKELPGVRVVAADGNPAGQLLALQDSLKGAK